MKFVLFVFTCLFGLNVCAFTSVKFLFLDQQVIITVTDEDAIKLYELMNTPVEQTAFGEGKGIQTDDAEFNLVCGKTNQQCKIILTASEFSEISGRKGEAKFHAKGDMGKILADSFYTTAANPMSFLSLDEKLKIQVLGEDEILLFYTKNP